MTVSIDEGDGTDVVESYIPPISHTTRHMFSLGHCHASSMPQFGPRSSIGLIVIYVPSVFGLDPFHPYLSYWFTILVSQQVESRQVASSHSAMRLHASRHLHKYCRHEAVQHTDEIKLRSGWSL